MYSSKDIAIVIPTRDRPAVISELLRSLANQSVRFGRIIIVDSGECLDSIIAEYSAVLPIEYYRSPPGQIRQRKHGLSLLNQSTPLVATIDDDLVFEPNAFVELLTVWNSLGRDVGGVGFNHRKATPNRISLLGWAFCMSSKEPGKVKRSGYNTSIAQVSKNIQTSWLGGGYSVWKLSVLREFEQEEISTRWAVGEDVRLSYSISKRYKLYVAHRAGFEEVVPPVSKSEAWQTAVYRGYKGAAAYYYLVKKNPELSRLLCVWMLFGRFVGKVLVGVAKLRFNDLYQAIGVVAVMIRLPLVELGILDLKGMLED